VFIEYLVNHFAHLEFTSSFARFDQAIFLYFLMRLAQDTSDGSIEIVKSLFLSEVDLLGFR
jgi:hypothetical protein